VNKKPLISPSLTTALLERFDGLSEPTPQLVVGGRLP